MEPPRYRAPGVAHALAVVLLLALAACDGGATDDPDTLLLDAQLARQDGRNGEAVVLLERAYELDPTHAAVRVELASALFEAADLDLLDLDRIARYLSGPEVFGSYDLRLQFDDSCADLEGEPFDLRGMDGYDAFLAQRGVVDRVVGLLHPTEGPALLPPSLRGDDRCTVGGASGPLSYDYEALQAELRATGLPDRTVAAALALNAVARVFEAYFFLSEDAPTFTRWIRADGEIVVCTEDPDALFAETEVALQDLLETVASLDVRIAFVGGDGELVRPLIESVSETYTLLTPLLSPCAS